MASEETTDPVPRTEVDEPAPLLGPHTERSEIISGGGVFALAGLGIAFMSLATKSWQFWFARFWFVAAAAYLVLLWRRWVYLRLPPWTAAHRITTAVMLSVALLIGVGGIMLVNYQEAEQRAVPPAMTINQTVSSGGVGVGVGVGIQAETVNIHSGPPTDDEIKADFKISKVPITTKSAQWPYSVGFQVKAQRFDHPQVYIRAAATAPIRASGKALPSPDAMRLSAGSPPVEGNVFEYTEGWPGLHHGEVMQFGLYSDVPIDIAEVEVKPINPTTLDGKTRH